MLLKTFHLSQPFFEKIYKIIKNTLDFRSDFYIYSRTIRLNSEKMLCGYDVVGVA